MFVALSSLGHIFLLFISHYARIVPSNRRKICLGIEHAKYKNNYEHLLIR